MKNIDTLRRRLNKAIESGCSKDVILEISKRLDDLIVEKMKIKYAEYIKGQARL